MQPRDIEIKTERMTFSALEWGNADDKPVLALHGWLDNAASFTPLAPRLKNVRLIAVDLAGHGRSQHRPTEKWIIASGIMWKMSLISSTLCRWIV